MVAICPGLSFRYDAHTYAQTQTHTIAHINKPRTHAQTQTHTHTNKQTHVHTYINTQAHTYQCARTYINTHAHRHEYNLALPCQKHTLADKHTSIYVPKQVDCSMCRFSKLLLFSFFVCKDGSDRLMKRASYSCCNFLCIVLAAAYLNYSPYRLSCLPLVWHFFFIVTHTHTHTHTHAHTHA